jgi:hypothetical protein
MKRFAMTVGLGAGLLLLGGHADAQWRYTDERGVTRVTQYKIDIPTALRDAAEWIGPVGVGNPALSEDQVKQAQRWEAIRRLVNAEAGLVQFRNMTPPPQLRDPGGAPRSMATMCIAGELRVMTSPGSWKVAGACSGGFSTGYGQDGYGSFGGMTIR